MMMMTMMHDKDVGMKMEFFLVEYRLFFSFLWRFSFCPFFSS